jgi:hypothetical protein
MFFALQKQKIFERISRVRTAPGVPSLQGGRTLGTPLRDEVTERAKRPFPYRFPRLSRQ